MDLPEKSQVLSIFKSCKLSFGLVYQQFVLTLYVMTNKANIALRFERCESWDYIKRHVNLKLLIM